MKPYYQDDAVTLYHSDCLIALQSLDDNSVDSIVTDPPYGLSFMGKKWDYDVPSVEVWAECLRVLKPGGHLLAFAGTRTQHRMAVRIEDAGFEIRDMIFWCYGSGFPKSLSIGKAIDKMDAVEEQQLRRYRFTEWVRSQGVTSKQIDEATQTKMGSHYTTHRTQPSIMTREHLEACRALFRDVPEWVEAECDIRSVESKNFAAREVVGNSENGIAGGTGKHAGQDGAYGFAEAFDITAPATEAAKQWDGWGSALKPALEPITMARKPLDGTIAANVLKHGVGGINVDGCRVEGGKEYQDTERKNNHKTFPTDGIYGSGSDSQPGFKPASGRFPANLIHDGSDEVVGLFPSVKTGGPGVTKENHNGCTMSGPASNKDRATIGYDDSGSAARFFYTAKADATERRNSKHPTVKPIALMRYLVRLVTPIGATVLDPFMGSGTTIEAARAESCKSIGMEREAEYCADATKRLSQGVLF